MRPLNFASQPFRNERLPVLLFGLASVLLLGATAYHALVVRALLPARTSKLHQEVAGLERELDQLRAENRTLTAPKPDKQAIAEWVVLKDLVDRRTFSWTGLFARLEQVLPRQVKLVSIAPDVKQGQVVLEILAVAQPAAAGLSLVGLLEQRPEFEDVYPVNLAEGDTGSAEFSYKMRYLPGAPDEALASAADAAEPAEDAAIAQPAALPAARPQPTASAGPPPPTGKPVAALAGAPPAPAARPAGRPAEAPPAADPDVQAPAPPRSRRAPVAVEPAAPDAAQDVPPPNDQLGADSDSDRPRVISKKPQPRDN